METKNAASHLLLRDVGFGSSPQQRETRAADANWIFRLELGLKFGSSLAQVQRE